MTHICQDSQALRDKIDLHVEVRSLLFELQVENFYISKPGDNFCTASPDFSLTTGILKHFQLSIVS